MYIMYCGECGLVGYLMFSQEGAPQTQWSKIIRNTGNRQLSVGRIVHDLLRTTHARKTTRCLVSNVFSGSVATKLR